MSTELTAFIRMLMKPSNEFIIDNTTLDLHAEKIDLLIFPEGSFFRVELLHNLIMDGICIIHGKSTSLRHIDTNEFEIIDFPEIDFLLIKRNPGVISWMMNDDSKIYTRSSLMECRDIIFLFAKILKPKTYLELGIRGSPTVRKLLQTNINCYGVDINPACAIPNLNFTKGTTDEFFNNNNLSFDMIFIDACHKIDFVIRDLENSLNVINNRGLILMHDTYPGGPGMLRSNYCSDAYKIIPHIREYLYPGKVRFINLPFSPGLTILRKRLD